MASNYKRSKLKLPCANPVFEKWIEELRNDAMDRELKSKHSFTKVVFLIFIMNEHNHLFYCGSV